MEYRPGENFIYLAIGLVFLGVIIFSLRQETEYLLEHRKKVGQFVLSVLSIFVMIVLSVTMLGNWFIPKEITLLVLLTLSPILLVLSLIILVLRQRNFKEWEKEWRAEQKKLISEIEEIIDAKKRERINEGKAERGEKSE